MAGNAVIGALRVVLGADTAALETGLKNAQGMLSDFGNTAGKALAAAGTAMAAGLTAASIAVKRQINAFDDLSKTSQKIGVPVEQLAALRYAAQLSDVSSESLTKGLGKLARSAVDAAQGSTTAVAAYQMLGVSFRDAGGNVKSVGDLLPQIADRFASMKDGTAKTALAMQIFGKAGADLIPLLNAGRAGLKEMTDEAAAFGLVIDQNTARAAEQFNDNLTRLNAIFDGLVRQVTAQMLPALLQFNQLLIDFAKNTDLVKATADGIVTTFKFMVEEVVKAAVAFSRAKAEFMALWEVLKAPTWEKMKEAWANFRAEGAKSVDIFNNVGEVIKKFNDDAAKGFEATGQQTKKTFDPAIIKTSKDALDSFIDSKKKQIAVFQAEASTLGMSNIAQQQAKIVAEGLATAQANHIPITQALKDKLQALAETWSKWNETANFGKQIFEQTRTPAEQFAATMERLNLAFDYGKESPELYARGVAMAQQQLVQAVPEFQAFEQAAESAFDKAIDGTLKFQDVLKDLFKTIAKQQFKNLLLGSQGGSSGGILGSLAGASTGGIGSIFSGIGKLFGFANGGQFNVGGSGGIDSQLVAFRASPNETVSVTKPGQNAFGGGPSISMPINITAPGASEAGLAWVARELQDLKRSLPQQIVGVTARVNSRGMP